MLAGKRVTLSQAQRMDAERLHSAWARAKHTRHVSQKELAAIWGVHPSNVSQYIKGHIPLNTEAKLWFAKYLRTPAIEIWPDFEWGEALTMTLPPAAADAAKLIAALDEEDQATVLKLLRSLPHRAA